MLDSITNLLLSNPNLIYIIIFISIFINGLINFPSSQVIYIFAGYLISVHSNISIIATIVVGGIANALSNLILHLIIKKHHNKIIPFLNRFTKIDDETIEFYKQRAIEKGFFWLAIGKSLPSIKVYIPIITGLIQMRNSKSFLIFLLGSISWASIFILSGYYFGKNFSFTNFVIFASLLYFLFAIWALVRLKNKRKLNNKKNII